jgi:uncharacterized membrane protein
MGSVGVTRLRLSDRNCASFAFLWATLFLKPIFLPVLSRSAECSIGTTDIRMIASL